MSTENSNSNREDGPASLSRRDLLAAAGGSAMAAAAAGVAGCSSNTTQPKVMGILEDTGQKEANGPADLPPRDTQPAFSWKEGTAIVKDFSDQHKVKLEPETRIHGVQFITESGGRKRLEVLYSSGEKPDLPKEFVYRQEGRDPMPLEVRLIKRDAAIPHVRLGHWAQSSASAVAGTAGWNICVVDGGVEKIVCMSARHTLCPDFFNPQIGAWVWLNKLKCAHLLRAEPIVLSAFNKYDMAIARYVDPTLINDGAEDMYIQCQTGYPNGPRPWGYPLALATNVLTGQSYHKVGAGTPACSQAILQPYLNGYGNRSFPYTDAQGATVWVRFQDQLIFGPFCKGGDSGAIVARDGDYTAAGLHYAGTAGVESVSCPIFTLPWTQQAGNETITFTGAGGNPRTFPRFVI